jgi:hypothetical protein
MKTGDIGSALQSVGTRFLIYPQVPHLTDYGVAETVWISTPPDRLRPGPSDHRVDVRDPLLAKEPYGYPFLPPFVGDTYPPAEAGFDGHFDTVDRGSRQFLAAHAYACASRVLDVWESYLGHPITWHFAETYERLEIIPSIDWDNAQSGYGYLELGHDRSGGGQGVPYALNFDVIAHEIGHAILFSLCGFPVDRHSGEDFGAVHESMSDLIALLSFLHFDTGLDRLLRHSNGNLLMLNELNRIAELTGDRQIRLASNSRKLGEVTRDVHDSARPLTGAIFDTIVDAFHSILVRDGLADERLLNIDFRDLDAASLRDISGYTTRNFRERPFLYKSALTQARDQVALILAKTLQNVSADEFEFGTFAGAALAAAARIDTALDGKLAENLAWREII